jgi:hypothetical protein
VKSIRRGAAEARGTLATRPRPGKRIVKIR